MMKARGLTLFTMLPFIFSGDSYERKLRFSLLVAGMSSAGVGLFLLNLNLGFHDNNLITLYTFSSLSGVLICISAFIRRIETSLYFATHVLLIIILFILLMDYRHPDGSQFAELYLIVLSVGSALVLRKKDLYFKFIYPLTCFSFYIFFITTGIHYNGERIIFSSETDSVFAVTNHIVPVIALLTTVFAYRGDYSDTDLVKKDLGVAISHNQFELFYQPQVNGNQQPVGLEALIRWRHPAKGLISPDNFIPVAERSGLIIPLGKWVMEEAFRQLDSWRDRIDLNTLTLSVNISPVQMMNASFVKETEELLEKYHIQPSWVKFEITETTFIYDYGRISEIINSLNTLGVKWSVDDFGAGYSSLRSLSEFPVDEVKLDKSLVMNIFENDSASLITEKTIELANQLNKHIVAEGVETDLIFLRLKEMGCHIYQGYLFSKPLSAEDTLRYLKRYPRRPAERVSPPVLV